MKLYCQDSEIQIMEVYICALNLSFLYENSKCNKVLLRLTQNCMLQSSTDNVPVIPPYQAIHQSLLHVDVRQVTKALHWFQQKTSSIWYTIFRIHFGGYLICQKYSSDRQEQIYLDVSVCHSSNLWSIEYVSFWNARFTAILSDSIFFLPDRWEIK